MNRNNQGFSLIEVLVALLLTTVGVLGMVALQGRSVQYSQDSVQRNVAVDLASELIEIIRANPGETFTNTAPAFPMNSGLQSTSIFYKAKAQNFSSPADCVASATVVAKTAKEQRDCWASKAQALLPGGSTVFTSDTYICRSSSAGNCNGQGSMIEIRLAWQVREGACLDAADTNNSSTICTYTVRVQP
ncbi:type IV pilus modification protein PilV [Pseudomonas seleniipraecipitans]|uniref:Type IV pilus modification protein PilV n=1 Tax=Phytopseudomonas seleniipraecipitans TaxID=640205 RepID=A0ABY5JDI6_9GAMM|nr:type IV pilus modification protein PilV [Pseudomonas seleniipraecipitans]UUD66134.1 type IV pilus modification protein PilV [Pseudomonas seleniipraecipitans]